MTKTRRRASNGVRVAAATTGSSTSPTRIPAALAGATQVRSGCTPCSTRVRALPGSGAPSESSAAAKARAAAAFPLPAGPWKRYACDGLPSGGSAAPRTARAWGWRSREGSMGRLGL